MGKAPVAIKVLRPFIGANPNIKIKIRKVCIRMLVTWLVYRDHFSLPRFSFLAIMARIPNVVKAFTSEHRALHGFFIRFYG